jgi:hypothetical protein
MSTDGEGRPLSDDGQWAWNGTEWVPAAIGGAVPAPTENDVAADPNATVIAVSPFARGSAPEVNQPGAPPAKKDSYKALIISIVAAVIIIAVVAILVVTLSSDKKSAASPAPSPSASAGPAGTYVCTAPGSTDTGTITFNAGMQYSLSNEAKPGTYAETGVNLTFAGGGLDRATGTYTADAKTVQVVFNSLTLTCKQ